MSNDDPLEPASDDGWVQDHLDATWRAAMAGLRESMEQLRKVVPEMSHHLPEAAYTKLQSALRDAERGYQELHQAGPLVIGTAAYEDYLQAQTERRIGS